MNQEHVPEWEQILGIPVNDLEPFRRNVRLITPAGDWVVKPVRYPAQLRWWLSVDRELRMRGFQAMPPIYTDGGRWLITPLIDGFPVSYRDRKQVRKAARLLATFHRLGRGLATPPFHRRSHQFLRRLDARLSSFGRLLKTAEGIEGEIGELLRLYGKTYYRYGLEARKRIADYPLFDLFEREWRARFVVHQDLASHNWLVDRGGNLWLIDFETADYDWQLGDLWQFLSRVLPEQGWSRSVWSEIIAAYGEIRPLSSLEMAILRDLLGFPNEFFRETSGVIKGKRGYHPEAVIPYLKRIVGATPAWRRFLKTIR
jgi:Phosphotransferase enzyme family